MINDLNNFNLPLITVDDIVIMILVEAGYEEHRMAFDEADFQTLLYKHFENISYLRDYISFRTTGTYPYSKFIDRVFRRLAISRIFWSVGFTQLARGEREYIEPYTNLRRKPLDL